MFQVATASTTGDPEGRDSSRGRRQDAWVPPSIASAAHTKHGEQSTHFRLTSLHA
jgi:hypothetical protein